MKAKYLSFLLIFLTANLILSGCGKKGGPFPPKDEIDVYPRQYPSS